jgi:tetratricopeptide (TPR) repeat protein
MRHTLVTSLLYVATAWAATPGAVDPGNQAYQEGRYAEAEQYFSNALKTVPDESGITTYNLAAVYRAQARHREADPLYRKVIAIRESALGPRHPSLAAPLDGLALTCQGLDRLAEAEELATRAMQIENTPRTMNILAMISIDRGEYRQAARLAEKADSSAGLSTIEHAELLSTLALLNRRQNRYEKAESLYREAAALFERTIGPRSPTTAVTWSNLAQVLTVRGRLAEADALYRRSIAILERAYGQDDYRVAAILHNQANLRSGLFVDVAARPIIAGAFVAESVAAQSQVPHCRPEICSPE